MLVDLYMVRLELPGSLAWLLLQTTKRVQDPASANIHKSVMVEAQADPEMRALVLQKIVEPRRQSARRMIERGKRPAS